MVQAIYHLITTQNWEIIQKQAFYEPESLFTEGFIHCSTGEQLIGTANRFFSQEPEMTALHIDTTRVQAEIKYEEADNQFFPHIYGKLNLDAVVEVSVLNKNLKGDFIE